MLSSFAVEHNQLTGFTKAMTGMTMKSALKDKAIAEEMFRASDRDWTIIRAARLTNAAASGAAGSCRLGCASAWRGRSPAPTSQLGSSTRQRPPQVTAAREFCLSQGDVAL